MVEEQAIIVAQDVAENEFNEWCDSLDIEHDEDLMDGEDLANFLRQKKRIVNACMKGALVFAKDGIEYTISAKSPEKFAGTKLEIGLPTGKMFIAQDDAKDGKNFKKINFALAALTGKTPEFFEHLFVGDYNVLTAVLVFFITI